MVASIAVLLVAVAVGLYHVGVLRRDQALRASAEPEVAAPVVVEAARAGVVLRLSGPAGSDTAAAAAALRAHLPPGYSLEVVEE